MNGVFTFREFAREGHCKPWEAADFLREWAELLESSLQRNCPGEVRAEVIA